MKRAEKRQHLIDVATRLFNEHGYHAAGVDRVIQEAGIAKTTLYRHFGSKDRLIVEVLKRIDEAYRDGMRRTVEAAGGDARGKLLATFDFLQDWFNEASFHGCPFVSAAAEFGEQGNAVLQEAVVHKRLVCAYLEELARAAGASDPKGLANAINLLHEGAIAVAHVTGHKAAAQQAKALARKIIDDELKGRAGAE